MSHHISITSHTVSSKKTAWLLAVAAFCFLLVHGIPNSFDAQAESLDIMSFNIRFDKGTDGTNNWNYAPDPRREKVFTTISNYDPDIFGVQEAFDNQVTDLETAFPDFFYIGEQTSLDPVNMPGEHSGLFFRSDRFTLIEEGTFWYSNTPDSPGTFFSQAAGSSSTRSSSWAKVYDQLENQTIAVMNNHWYSNSASSRRLTAPLVRQKVDDLLGNLPLIMLGDFNATNSSTEIRDLKGQNDPEGFQLTDTYREIHTTSNASIDGTSNGNWTGATNKKRVDSIYRTNRFTTTAAGIDHTSFGSGANTSYPSDHFPVTATLELNNLQSVLPTAETTPSIDGHDSIDDPAIWIDSNNPSNSFIIGADKSNNGSTGGRLELYNIINGSGTASTSLFGTVGNNRFNNVDLRYGFDLDGQSVDLVVASNRTTDELTIFKVDPINRTLIDVTGITAAGIEPYGLTLHQATNGTLYAFASDNNGNDVRQYELTDNGSGNVNAALVRTISMNGLVEGMVVDDENGVLYIGEEDAGIYRFSSDPSSGNTNAAAGTVIDLVGNGNLTADIEGLTIYDNGSGVGYLIASSQGDSTFAVYSLTGTNELLAQFTVDDNNPLGIDGASITDGLDVTSAALGTAFPEGFLIVMDDVNTGSGSGNDNFKLIPWESIESIILGSSPNADFDNDGDVDGSDFLAWQTGFGSGATHVSGDANGDGNINAVDFAIWQAQYGNSNGEGSLANAAIPEPSGIVLLVLATLATVAASIRVLRFRPLYIHAGLQQFWLSR